MAAIQTLHILNKSPDHPRASRCIAMLASQDALLLIGNAVLFLGTSELPDAEKVFALTPDVEARGLQLPEKSDGAGSVYAVDFADMVSLSIEAQRVISW